MTHAVLNAMIRPMVEPSLPRWLEAEWFSSTAQLMEMAPRAEIGWFDLWDKPKMAEAIGMATRLKWLNSIYAGIDHVPLALLDQRGVVYTNGAGINAMTIAEWVVMGMLSMAKDLPTIIRAADARQWLEDAPGKRELYGSKALLLGYGAIGQLVDARLAAFGVEVVKVRRSGGEGALRPDEWRGRLGEFDWVILALPATPETEGMIGAAELAAMKPDCIIVNVARGSVIDQPALVEALTSKTIAGAGLDVFAREPQPPDELTALPNVVLTPHTGGHTREAHVAMQDCVIANLQAFFAGKPLPYAVRAG